MPFTSLTFLFLLLPLVLAIYSLVPYKGKSYIIAFASFVFVAWARITYVPLIAISLFVNWKLGELIARNEPPRKYLIYAISFNLLVLIIFKYSAFFCVNLNFLLQGLGIPALNVPKIILPLGISFYTFRILSYHIDLSRRKILPAAGIKELFNYMFFFPQLGAGPIVRYNIFTEGNTRHRQRLSLISNGSRRFLYGLIKKILIANTLGQVADAVFLLPANDLTLAVSWLGVVSYGLQVYYDFSAYTDMAIGISMCFGYKAPENFNFPYMARSVRDFWTRWHMTLTDWFRDYLFLPLAYAISRKMPSYRTFGVRTDLMIYFLSTFITWILIGFWHGADWTFIVWGLWFGIFLSIEQSGFRKTLKKLPRIVQHIYTIIIIIVAWVFFRSGTFGQGWDVIRGLTGLNGTQAGSFPYYKHVNPVFLMTLTVAVAGAAGWLKILRKSTWKAFLRCHFGLPKIAFRLFDLIILLGLFLVSIAEILRVGYSPFIYFKF